MTEDLILAEAYLKGPINLKDQITLCDVEEVALLSTSSLFSTLASFS